MPREEPPIEWVAGSRLGRLWQPLMIALTLLLLLVFTYGQFTPSASWVVPVHAPGLPGPGRVDGDGA